MDVEIPSFQESQRIGDVLRSLKRLPSAYNHVFVTNDAKQFSGVIPVAELLRQDESTILLDLVDSSLKPLSNRASLLSCEAQVDWDRMNLLPVIGRKQNFLGALSRASLRKALAEDDDEDSEILPGSILMQLLSAILIVGAAFADLMMPHALSAEPATRKRKSGGR